MKRVILLFITLLLIVVVFWQCNNKAARTGQWCVYEIVAAEGKCPSGWNAKNFCRYCISPCPQNFDTTIVSGNDTCYYTLRVIDRNCRTCPANSLP